jgi:hypothetical protein
LQDYFDYDKSTGFHIYTLKNGDVRKFLSDIAVPFRHCYIIDAELDEAAIKNKMAKSEFLDKYVLPDGEPQSQSGGSPESRQFVEPSWFDPTTRGSDRSI